MALIDQSRLQLDKSVRMIDKFYNFDITVGAAEYDIVHSYFYNISKNTDVADNFTVMVFRIASMIDENPMDVLANVKGSSSMEINALMAYYLNNIKSKTSLYGIGVTPVPNQTVQRNVII